MAKVTGLTASRMYQIEQASIVSGRIENEDELILYTRGGTRIRAGVVKGGTAEWIQEYKPIIDGQQNTLEDHQNILDGTKETIQEVYEKLQEHDPVVEAADNFYTNELPVIRQDVSSAVGNSISAIEKANDTIKMVEVEYSISTSSTIPPTTDWSSDMPVRGTNQYIWMRSKITRNDGQPATYTSAALITGDQGNQGIQGIPGEPGQDGIPGAPGVGLSQTTIDYAIGSSNADIPTSGWSSKVPTLVKGNYLWTRTKWTYTDDSEETGYSLAYIAKDGNSGSDGIAGKDGVGIRSTTITYAQSTSGTNPPSSDWQSQPPSPIAGRYVWTKTVWEYTDGTNETGYSVGKIGDTGAKGDKGDKGDTGKDGLPGSDGVGLVSTTIHYAKATSGTVTPTSGWQEAVPTSTPGQFLWTRTVWTYSDKSSETGYSVAMWGATGSQGAPGTPGVKGDKGDTGNDGIAGKDGVGIKSTTITYAKSASGTVSPSTGWTEQPPEASSGNYVWTKTVWTYTDNTTETGYSVGKIGDTGAKGDKGNTGEQGEQGISVSSILPLYRLVSSSEPQPDVPLDFLGNIFDFNLYIDQSNAAWTRNGPNSMVITTTTAQFGYYLTNANSFPMEYNTDYELSFYRETLSGTPPLAKICAYMQHSTSATGAMTTTFPGQGRTNDAESDGKHVFTVNSSVKEIKRGGVGFYTRSPYIADQQIQISNAMIRKHGGWSSEEPPYQEGSALYKTELILYSNGQYQYTPVTQVSSYEAAEQAIEFANMSIGFAENLVVASIEEPEHALGRIWLKLVEVYPDDESNDETYLESIFQSDGEIWSRYGALYDIMLVPREDGGYNVLDKSGLDVNNAFAQTLRAHIFSAEKVRAGEIDIAAVKMENLDDSEGEVGTIIRASDRWNKRTMIEPGRITIADQPGSAENYMAPQMNLIRNPDGAKDIDHWTCGDGGTLYAGTLSSKWWADLGGASSGRTLRTTADGTTTNIQIRSNSAIISSSDKYVTISSLVATDSAMKVRFRVRFYDADGYYKASDALWATDVKYYAGGRVSTVFAIPEGRVRIRLEITAYRSDSETELLASGKRFWVNNVWMATFDDYYQAREAQEWSIPNPSMALTAMVLEPTRLTMIADGNTEIYLDSERNQLFVEHARIKKSIHIGAHLMQTVKAAGSTPDLTLFNWVGDTE